MANGNPRPVRCLVTGHVYPSTAAAARAVHASVATLRRRLEQGQPWQDHRLVWAGPRGATQAPDHPWRQLPSCRKLS